MIEVGRAHDRKWALQPLRLEYEDLLIRTYTAEDIRQIAPALVEAEGYFASRWNLDTAPKIAARLEELILGRDHCNPLVYFSRGEVAGITRFMKIDTRNRCLEIGGTWVAPKFRRTHVNTMTKHLLLNFLFEDIGTERVEFMVDERNYPSQMAILRVGATFEGQRRHRQIYPNGEITNGNLYSIIRPDWPQISSGYRPSFLSRRFESERLTMSAPVLGDAKDFMALFKLGREEEALALIAKSAHRRSQNNEFNYVLRHKDLFIGVLTACEFEVDKSQVQVSVEIGPGHRRQGFGREAIFSICEQLKQKQSSLRIFSELNAAESTSNIFAQKVGFLKQGQYDSSQGLKNLYGLRPNA